MVGPCFQLLANFMLSAVEFDSQLQVRQGLQKACTILFVGGRGGGWTP